MFFWDWRQIINPFIPDTIKWMRTSMYWDCSITQKGPVTVDNDPMFIAAFANVRDECSPVSEFKVSQNMFATVTYTCDVGR